MQQKDKRVIAEYVCAEGYVVKIFKNPKAPKQITVKPKGSVRHLGRTNCFGVRV
jgi:hypothetical protein